MSEKLPLYQRNQNHSNLTKAAHDEYADPGRRAIEYSGSGSVNSGRVAEVKSLAMINTRTVVGVSALSVMVEVHLANGLPAFTTVGLPEITVKESKERVRGAILNSGFEFPAKRITVNLAPADLPKTGGRFDLPIAIGILVASGQLNVSNLSEYEMVGELALDGRLRKVSGALPTAVACNSSQRTLILPEGNSLEAALGGDGRNFHSDHLLGVCRHLAGQTKLPVCTMPENVVVSDCQYPDMSDVKGQQKAKRAIEIAACGGHSLLFVGPPGTGKSMLASRLPGVLPDLSLASALEVAAIESVSKGVFDVAKWRKRPYRSPHHSASSVALVGGGSFPRPGEITLAHKGILFLDELTEFSRSALEQLREPLESGKINIARANQSVQYPAQFMLIAACNPCKCGYYGDGTDRCRCSAMSVENYRGKLSGPMLDRIDMHVHLMRVSVKILQENDPAVESSAVVKARVEGVRMSQIQRQGKLNSDYANKDITHFCQLGSDDLKFLAVACEKLSMSARAYHRVLKLARTIADMDGKKNIERLHLSEALGLRSLDRQR